MFSLCDTLRASDTACGPQHLSSARFTQSCGHSFNVMPTTSYPCSNKSAAAAEESTPPLIPTTTRVFAPVFTSHEHTGTTAHCKAHLAAVAARPQTAAHK